MQNEVEGGRRAYIRGRIAYDEANERYRILEGEETHDGSIRVETGRYYFYKEVCTNRYQIMGLCLSCLSRFVMSGRIHCNMD